MISSDHVETTVPIAMATSSEYAPYLAVMLASLAAHSKPDTHYEVIVLHEGLSTDLAAQLEEVIADFHHITLRLVIPPAHVRDKLRRIENRKTAWPRLVFYRLFLAEMFPEYDKMIFLGVDVLIHADLAELFAIPLGDAPLAAVADGYFLGAPGDFASMYQQRGVSMPPVYCNSDVQVQNLRAYREGGIGDAILDSVLRHDFPLIEQDAMNVVLPGMWKPLTMEWNYTLPRIRFLSPGSYAGIPEAVRTRSEEIERSGTWKIIHYQADKPWALKKCETSPFTDLWWKTALSIPAFAREFEESLAKQRRELEHDLRKQRLRALFSLPHVRRKRAQKADRLARTLAMIDAFRK